MRDKTAQIQEDSANVLLTLVPGALINALLSSDVVALLGPTMHGSLSIVGLASSLQGCLQRSLQGGTTDPNIADMVRRLQDLTSAETTAEDSTQAPEPKRVTDLDLMLGDVCSAVGRNKVWTELAEDRHTASSKSSSQATLRLQALAATRVTAVVTSHWTDELEEMFPHRVGRNFGGYAATLSRPRIDRKIGRSLPVLQLWPGLPGSRRDRAAEGANALPSCRDDCEQFLAAEGPYMTFLRDLFRTKVAMLAGWSLPPSGHLGMALHSAWQEAKLRHPGRVAAIAYAFAISPSESCRSRCFAEFGLEVLSYNDAGTQGRGLELCFRALAKATDDTLSKVTT